MLAKKSSKKTSKRKQVRELVKKLISKLAERQANESVKKLVTLPTINKKYFLWGYSIILLNATIKKF
jgi:hypothetical protein